jgi:hypothetical protein
MEAGLQSYPNPTPALTSADTCRESDELGRPCGSGTTETAGRPSVTQTVPATRTSFSAAVSGTPIGARTGDPEVTHPELAVLLDHNGFQVDLL